MEVMAKNAEEISNYTFNAGDELLLDANVWFFVYGPHRPGDPRASVYSGALAKILAAKTRIYIDVLIISEFINAYARLKHNILKGRSGIPNDFKRFRATPAFKQIAEDIAADTRKILANCTCVESGFATLDIDSLINVFQGGNSDFNDLVLVDLCKRNALKLVTDDGDFQAQDITILTANRKLLI
jgi:predicted nucleic acid-binding protein